MSIQSQYDMQKEADVIALAKEFGQTLFDILVRDTVVRIPYENRALFFSFLLAPTVGAMTGSIGTEGAALVFDVLTKGAQLAEAQGQEKH